VAARSIALGVVPVALASALAALLWDEQFLLVPAGALLLGVLAGGVLGGRIGGVVSLLVSTAAFALVFVPHRQAEAPGGAVAEAIVAYVVAAGVMTVVIDLLSQARRRADGNLASLDALVDNAPIGVAFLDRDLRFVRVNAALASIAGRDVEAHLGKRLEDAIDREDATRIAQRVLDSGEPELDVRLQGTSRSGRAFEVACGYYPVRGADGSIEGVGVVVRDITDSVVAERQRDEVLERLTRLQRITGQLAAARTTPEVVRVVLDDVRRAAGADAASLATVEGERISVAGATGYDGAVLERFAELGTTDAAPLGEAVRSAQVVEARTRDDVLRRWPHLEPSMPPARQALVAVPLLVGGVVEGAVGLSYDRELDASSADQAFLVALATQCAQALRRARLHDSEEAARTRLAFLAEASDALASSLDWEGTLRRVCELAVPRLADLAAAFAVRDGEISAIEVSHADPARVAELRAVIERWPATMHQASGLGAVLRTGEPVLGNDLTPELLATAARDQEHAAALAAAGFSSLLAVPMRVQDRIVGAIVLGGERGRRLEEGHLAIAMELATRAGQAVVNAQLFEERSRIAATLQASLLPPATPEVPGTELATRFFAVGQGIDVGGDFYDVFRLGPPAAPEDRWAIVIGDVRGKGTEAASISGTARHAIRATGLHERSPGAILGRLNELLLATGAGVEQEEPWFCTAAVAVVEPRPDGVEVVLAVGGHPKPFVVRASGEVEALPQTGPLLGILPDATVSDLRVSMAPGDALVLYTDGVTERHEGDRFFDEEGLAAVLARCAGFTAAALAERIETASRAFVEDAPRDDLAIVVLRVPTSVAQSTGTSADLPDDVSAPTLARRFVTAALEALGASQHADVAALLASELATNAVLHAAPPLRISLEPAPGAVRISVSDATPGHPAARPPSDSAPSGRGLALVDALAARWGVDDGPAGKAVWFEVDL
jgi:PAS domain S-box-containing protein